jgi:cytoskeletal protein CcmA (bactofilin family)
MSVGAPRRFFGKYRGRVLDNVDPLLMGRIMPDVPDVPGMLLNWAMPCVPYAGPGVGFLALPPIGAAVWIEFEGGDPTYPIWAGGFWELPEEMPTVPAIPERKIWKTEFITIMLDDTPDEGGLTIKLIEPVAPTITTMSFDVEGVSLKVPESTILVTPETISASIPPAEVSMTAEVIEVEIPATTITIDGESIVIETPEMDITANVSIEGPVEITGNVEITGAVEITGNVEITGAVEIEGNVEITGAVEIEGNVEIVGAVEVQGNVNVLGAFEVEGDVNILGAGQVEGNFAVAGLIEGIVVPPLL